MRMSILVIHIIGGTLGMLSGYVAIFLRKGSRRHAIVGKVFVVSMLTMAACGVVLAAMKSDPSNMIGGTFTFYLVGTAWLAGRRKDREARTSLLDWAGLLVTLGVSALEITWGSQAALSPTGMKFNYPPGPFFFMGSVAVLATVGDVRLLLRGGIAGTQRVARHLWRMSFGLFIAAASIFLARAHLFPRFMRKTGMLAVLSFLPLALLVFWQIRVRLVSAYKERRQSRASLIHSPA